MLLGKVTDQTGTAIAGVTVEVINPVTSATVATTTTTEFGTYALAIESGTYYIRVTPLPGSRFVPFTSPNRSIIDDTIINVVLVSPGLVVLSGQVQDANGHGIAGQRVELRSGSYEIFQVTDAAGNYRFQTVRGSYHLNISGSNQASAARNAPGGYSLTTKITPLTLTENMVLDLPLPFKRVVVHVQDSRGNPAANTKIEVSNPNNFNLDLGSFAAYGNSHYLTYPAFTNARGDAVLWLFPTDRLTSYTFTITPPAGTPFGIFTVSNITVTEDKYEMIVLQYDDASPAGTAKVRPALKPGELYG
ncbi:MAG TPA: carboxypeptidase regulatory-like domain-containing protein [Herpetosiphonaceae bacterium]